MFLPAGLGGGLILPRQALDPVDESLWNPDVAPATAPYVDTSPGGFNMGCLFTVTVIGSIHSLAYYRVTGMADSGTLSLWDISDSGSDMLASKSFSGHSGTGWRVVALDDPILSDPNAAYVAALWVPSNGSNVFTAARTAGYFTNKGYFSENGFLYASVSNGQEDSRGFTRRNGKFKAGAFALPDSTFQHDNFWVDVVINARPTPIPPLPPVVLKWPIPAGYPDESTTGPAAGTVFTTELEDVVSTANGQIIENLDVRGSISIQHNDVEVRNCKTLGTGPYGIYVYPGALRANIHHCRIDLIGRRNAGSTGIGLNGADATVRYCDILRCENGIAPQSTGAIIEHNFIHNLRATPGSPHYDGAQCDGGNNNLTINHNTIFNENGDTGVIMLDNFAGGSDGVVISNNYLAGAGYTCYCDAHFGGGPLVNVEYRNNLMRPGSFGYFNIQGATPEMTGNQLVEHGSIFDAEPEGGFTVGQMVPECFFAVGGVGGASVIGETTSVGDGLTLGMSFTPRFDGQITGLNFYRPGSTSSTYVKIGLWRYLGANKDAGVEFLGTRTIENIRRTGWWGGDFSAPVDVDANDNLLIGVFIPRGSDGKVWYLAENSYFASEDTSQWERLTAFSNSGTVFNGFTSCNGMYVYGPDIAAPLNAGGSATNYYVDPVFRAAWE